MNMNKTAKVLRGGSRLHPDTQSLVNGRLNLLCQSVTTTK